MSETSIRKSELVIGLLTDFLCKNSIAIHGGVAIGASMLSSSSICLLFLSVQISANEQKINIIKENNDKQL